MLSHHVRDLFVTSFWSILEGTNKWCCQRSWTNDLFYSLIWRTSRQNNQDLSEAVCKRQSGWWTEISQRQLNNKEIKVHWCGVGIIGKIPLGKCVWKPNTESWKVCISSHIVSQHGTCEWTVRSGVECCCRHTATHHLGITDEGWEGIY